ncbi:MAG: elongation factor G [Planctomycetaceae bacterium]|nr:elongation factor G [Planctomycetaceae bacterium]
MSTSSIENIRNIGIVAHIDAGKTTTTERVLYYTGASHKLGEVDEGTTQTDFDAEEAQRGITIYSAAVTCRWRDCRINIIDTPGHVDFTAEVQRSLRVLDGAVVIFSAVEGVEAQSETVWRQANEYGVPRICFINKMDRLGANFERTLKQIGTRLQSTPVPVTIPMGAGSPPNPGALEGIIDLIEMKALYFDAESKGQNFDVREIPEAFVDYANTWRNKLIDAVSLLDDEIMAAYLEGEKIPVDRIHQTLRLATIHGQLQPVFTGSSLDYCGVQPLLDGVTRYLPSPLDRPPVQGLHPHPKKDGRETRKPSASEPFCGLVFKIVADQHSDLSFVRVYSGVLKSGSRMLNPRTDKKELVSQLWHIQADQREKLEQDSVEAGDIVGVIGLKDSVTGDTLCDPKHPIILERITFPETVISMAAEPDSSAEKKKLDDALARLAKQDPTFGVRESEETGQTIISGMGELHLEVLRNRLERDFNLKMRVHKPRVSYRETVTKAAEVEGEFSRTKDGETHSARVSIRAEPFEGEDPITVQNKVKPGSMPAEFMKVLTQSVAESAQSGGKYGFPLMKVRFTVTGVKYKEGETTEDTLRAAASQAVMRAIDAAEVGLLQPIMKLEVVTPADFVGNIQADLNARHAVIVGSEPRGDLTVISAEAPLAKMFGYSNQVRSLSQGRASYSMEPLKYDLAPKSVLEDMMG